MMPTFSPDATQIAFTDLAIDGGHGLAVMSFDVGACARPATTARSTAPATRAFRAGRSSCPTARRSCSRTARPATSPAWVRHRRSARRFGALAPASDLYLADLATGTAGRARAGDGLRDASGRRHRATPTLPFGAEELHQHYYPTVSPVAAGGYFWVFFDSVRHYGNLGMQRQIWGAAITSSADGTYKPTAATRPST